MGYKTIEILVENNNKINVVLEEDAQSLNEVVVVGYVTQIRKNVTGAVGNC